MEGGGLPSFQLCEDGEVECPVLQSEVQRGTIYACLWNDKGGEELSLGISIMVSSLRRVVDKKVEVARECAMVESIPLSRGVAVRAVITVGWEEEGEPVARGWMGL